MLPEPLSSASVETTADPVGTSRGTRIVGYVVSLALGVLFGALGTVVHQISVSVFGLFDLPVGVIIALAATALLLVGLRLVGPHRLPALLAGVALVGTVTLFALPSQGGSVLIPDSVLGMTWLIGATLVAVVVLAWPLAARARR